MQGLVDPGLHISSFIVRSPCFRKVRHGSGPNQAPTGSWVGSGWADGDQSILTHPEP
jgi:hypothetical protein